MRKSSKNLPKKGKIEIVLEILKITTALIILMTAIINFLK